MLSPCQSSDSLRWPAIVIVNSQAADIPDCAANMLHPRCFSSRAPSPSGQSPRPLFPPSPSPPPSEMSTAAESLPRRISSGLESLEDALSGNLEDSVEEQDFVVKNTFIEVVDGDRMRQKKLFRSSSAPSILQSSPFEHKAVTMMELHDAGKCRPCAFVCDKRGCRAGLACSFCHMCSPEELSKAFNAKNFNGKNTFLKARRLNARKGSG